MAKIADHRNEGFDGKAAHYEDVCEKTKSINRQIVTKEGLKLYSDDEVAERSSTVKEYNYNNRYSWNEFKKMPEINKQEYIKHLRMKYRGLRIRDFSDMFGVNPNVFAKAINGLKIYFHAGPPRKEDDKNREKFHKEMCENLISEEELNELDEIVENPEKYSETEEPEKLMGGIEQLTFVSKVCDIDNVLKALNMAGSESFARVSITPYKA